MNECGGRVVPFVGFFFPWLFATSLSVLFPTYLPSAVTRCHFAEYGLDVNLPNAAGDRPVHVACKAGLAQVRGEGKWGT